MNFSTLILTLGAFFASQLGAAQEIQLIRPAEGESFAWPVKGVIVGGNVGQSGWSEVWINGERTAVYRTGAFMTYLNLSREPEGRFTVTASSAADAAPLSGRTITLEKAETAELDRQILSSLEPRSKLLDFPPRETVSLSFEAPALGQAFYKVPGLTSKAAFTEARPGFYESRLTWPDRGPEDDSREGVLTLWFKESNGRRHKVETKKKIRFSPGQTWPKTIKVGVSRAKILSQDRPGSYWFSAASGTILTADGQLGNLYRLRLAGALQGWIASSEAQEERSLPKPQTIDTIEVSESAEPDADTTLRVGWQGASRLPFIIEPSGERRLTLRIFNARIHLNRLPYKPSERPSMIRGVTWRIPQEDEVDLEIELSEPLRWGYLASSLRNGLLLRLRQGPVLSPPPPPAPKFKVARRGKGKHKQAQAPAPPPPKRWLGGLKVVLDAGHGGKETGATGSLGISERETTLRLTKEVARLLEEAGAKPVLTRSSTDQTLALEERVETAREISADLFISIHANDFPSTVDPLASGPWGSSIYYFHDTSLALAQAIGRRLNKPDKNLIPFNGVYWGDLYVVRELTMPSVLIETGYMTLPAQEELLALDKDFASNLAEAIASALEDYIKKSR